MKHFVDATGLRIGCLRAKTAAVRSTVLAVPTAGLFCFLAYAGARIPSVSGGVRAAESAANTAGVSFHDTAGLNRQSGTATTAIDVASAGNASAVGFANPVVYVARSNPPIAFAGGSFFLQGPANSCDLNNDGLVDNSDVLLAISMSLGLSPCTADILGPGVCNVIVVQRVINAATSGSCVTGNAHTVSLTWVASTSLNVAGYTVYRGTTLGGPYTKLNSSLVVVANYIDSTVQAGQTYYYVVTASDTSNNESVYSNEAQAVVPSP